MDELVFAVLNFPCFHLFLDEDLIKWGFPEDVW